MKNKWMTEFPKEPGEYWFYGYRYGRKPCGSPAKREWCRVRVSLCATKAPMYIAEGLFMWPSEVEDPHFIELEFPELPEDLKD